MHNQPAFTKTTQYYGIPNNHTEHSPMTINPNYTIKDTNTAKVQMKHWGYGQLRLSKQHTLLPEISPSYKNCTGK